MKEKNTFSKIRKISLLAVIIVLAVIYICQVSFTGRSKIKTLTLNEEIDSLQINDLKIYKENGNWFLGEKKYPANEAKVNNLVNDVKEIKLLGTASTSFKNAERYGLTDEEKISVQAFGNGKLLREIFVGKNTSTNSQSYICVDNKNSIYLAQNALHTNFTVSIDSLRKNEIFNIDSNSIVELELNSSNGNFVLVKNIPQGTSEVSESTWNLVKSENTGVETGDVLDKQKIDSWVKSISNLQASKWLEDDFVLPSSSDVSLKITAAGKTFTVDLYYEDDEQEITAFSNSSPYAFKVQSYVANRIDKKLSELK